MNAETFYLEEKGYVVRKLQWGRVRLNAETMSATEAAVRGITRFNGAAFV